MNASGLRWRGNSRQERCSRNLAGLIGPIATLWPVVVVVLLTSVAVSREGFQRLYDGSEMVISGHAARRAVVAVIGSGAVSGAMLFGGSAMAFAQPTPAPPPPAPAAPPPGCTAADLAQASGVVGTATGQYLFTHPDVNNFFTSLRGLPNEELRGRVQTYMDANPQVQAELNAIRQPVTDLRNRCDAPAPLDR